MPPHDPQRRLWLRGLGAATCWLALPSAQATEAVAPPATPTRLLAAWQSASAHHVGTLLAEADTWRVQAQCELPSRPHGLHALPDGSVLVAARRPGDWLLRWHPVTGHTQWHWEQGDQRFNGHVLTAPHDPRLLFSTETDLDSGEGRIGVRHLHSLARQTSWPSHGLDPHQLLTLPEPLGPWPAGTLLVANGGIPTQAESGRSKQQLDRMDPSLVALHPRDGTLLGQWRLPDPRLSVRHLAWDAVSHQVGVALQAEHGDEATRWAAPVFARWDGQALLSAQAQPVLQGYGGSVTAAPGGGFCVSCPRAQGVAWFDAEGRFQAWQAQAQVCPLALDQGRLWAGGGHTLQSARSPQRAQAAAPPASALDWQFDNHWLVLPPVQPTA